MRFQWVKCARPLINEGLKRRAKAAELLLPRGGPRRAAFTWQGRVAFAGLGRKSLIISQSAGEQRLIKNSYVFGAVMPCSAVAEGGMW